MRDFLDFRGHWDDWIAVERVALRVAGRAGDRPAQARSHRLLGRAHGQAGRWPRRRRTTARHWTCTPGRDAAGMGHVHFGLSFLRELQGRKESALRHSERALRWYREAGHEVGQARALNALGWDHAMNATSRPRCATASRR
jgi:hypothetical protein